MTHSAEETSVFMFSLNSLSVLQKTQTSLFSAARGASGSPQITLHNNQRTFLKRAPSEISLHSLPPRSPSSSFFGKLNDGCDRLCFSAVVADRFINIQLWSSDAFCT